MEPASRRTVCCLIFLGVLIAVFSLALGSSVSTGNESQSEEDAATALLETLNVTEEATTTNATHVFKKEPEPTPWKFALVCVVIGMGIGVLIGLGLSKLWTLHRKNKWQTLILSPLQCQNCHSHTLRGRMFRHPGLTEIFANLNDVKCIDCFVMEDLVPSKCSLRQTAMENERNQAELLQVKEELRRVKETRDVLDATLRAVYEQVNDGRSLLTAIRQRSQSQELTQLLGYVSGAADILENGLRAPVQTGSEQIESWFAMATVIIATILICLKQFSIKKPEDVDTRKCRQNPEDVDEQLGWSFVNAIAVGSNSIPSIGFPSSSAAIADIVRHCSEKRPIMRQIFMITSFLLLVSLHIVNHFQPSTTVQGYISVVFGQLIMSVIFELCTKVKESEFRLSLLLLIFIFLVSCLFLSIGPYNIDFWLDWITIVASFLAVIAGNVIPIYNATVRRFTTYIGWS